MTCVANKPYKNVSLLQTTQKHIKNAFVTTKKGDFMITAQDIMRKNTVCVDISETVSQLLSKLKRAKMHAALVYDKKTYLGVVNKRFLLTSTMSPSIMKVGNIVKHRSKSKSPFFVPKLAKDTPLRKIIDLLATADTHLLPVIDNDKIIGGVYLHDVLANITVKKTCEKTGCMDLVTIREEDELGKALRLFKTKKIDHLPVLDERGNLSGMLALSDLLDNPRFWGVSSQRIPGAAKHQRGKRTGYGTGEKSKMTTLPVKNFMTARVECISPTSSAQNAVAAMTKKGISTLVLAKTTKPLGIITARDLLCASL